jgi:hypothetical protein
MAWNKIDGSGSVPTPYADRTRGAERFERPGRRLEAGSGEAAERAGAGGDVAEISAGARKLVDLRAALEVGRAAAAELSDPRADAVEQARERLETGFYASEDVRLETAERVDRIMRDLDSL